jgi:hypothetical protein
VSSPAVLWQRLLAVEILQLHALRSYLHILRYRTASVAPVVFKVTPRHGPRRDTPFPTVTIVACVSVAAWTCLPSRYPETVLVHTVTAYQRLYNPQYCHVSGVPWLIITGSWLDDWIYWCCWYNYTSNYNHLYPLTTGTCPRLVPFPSWTTSVFSSTAAD